MLDAERFLEIAVLCNETKKILIEFYKGRADHSIEEVVSDFLLIFKKIRRKTTDLLDEFKLNEYEKYIIVYREENVYNCLKDLSTVCGLIGYYFVDFANTIEMIQNENEYYDNRDVEKNINDILENVDMYISISNQILRIFDNMKGGD